jgi:hypothetical protein
MIRCTSPDALRYPVFLGLWADTEEKDVRSRIDVQSSHVGESARSHLVLSRFANSLDNSVAVLW